MRGRLQCSTGAAMDDETAKSCMQSSSCGIVRHAVRGRGYCARQVGPPFLSTLKSLTESCIPRFGTPTPLITYRIKGLGVATITRGETFQSKGPVIRCTACDIRLVVYLATYAPTRKVAAQECGARSALRVCCAQLQAAAATYLVGEKRVVSNFTELWRFSNANIEIYARGMCCSVVSPDRKYRSCMWGTELK